MTPPSGLANEDLILLAILLAGGADAFTDIEEVGVWAHRLSPQRFGWRTKDFPSDKKVSQAITDLEHRNRDLMRRGTGNVASRRLLPEGLRQAIRVGCQLARREFKDVDAVLNHFGEQVSQEVVSAVKAGRRPGQGGLRALHRHQAFLQWADSATFDDLEPWELADSINCLPDASPQVLNSEIDKLETWAERWQDGDIARYLAALRIALLPRRGRD